jgi:Spy/CpxP family protein refolding chaperone
MKAIHASYLVAIVCGASGGLMADLPVSAQVDGSSEDFLIKTQLRPAPQAMPYLSDGSVANKTKGNISSKVASSGRFNGPACGPDGGGGPGHGGPPPGPGAMRRHGPPGPDPEFLKSLGLSDEQREKLHAIREKEHLSSVSRIPELTKLRHQLMESLTGADKSDNKSDALAIQRQINTLENANQLDRVASMLEAKAVFTDEQQKQMRRHMLEHEPLMGPPGGPMPGPMGGPMPGPMPGPMGPMGGPMPEPAGELPDGGPPSGV